MKRYKCNCGKWLEEYKAGEGIAPGIYERVVPTYAKAFRKLGVKHLGRLNKHNCKNV